MFSAVLDTKSAAVYLVMDSAICVETEMKWAICVRANFKWATVAPGQTSSGKSRHSRMEVGGQTSEMFCRTYYAYSNTIPSMQHRRLSLAE